MGRKYVVLGGNAVGGSFAARVRRLDENAEVTIVEKTGIVAFGSCGLPFLVGDVIHNEDALLVVKPELFNNRFNISVMLNTEGLSIDPETKTIQVRNVETQQVSTLEYDALLIGVGSVPLRPPLRNLDAFQNIFQVRTVPDAVHIRTWIEANKSKKAVVIGAGFIGLEMVENLLLQGLEVEVIEGGDQIMGPLDPEMAFFVHEYLVSKGVKIHLNSFVAGFDKGSHPHEIIVSTKDEQQIAGDIVIMGLGVRPNTELAKTAGCEVVPQGIVVNEYMETTVKDIYAAGDAVAMTDVVTKQKVNIPLAHAANKTGRIVADNMCGKKVKFRGVQGTSVCRIFDLTMAQTGASEKALKRAGITDFEYVLIHPKNHAGYYPGSHHIHLKLLFAKSDGKVLGCQAIGEGDGVEKQIDVISVAIQAGMTIYDLEDTELCYSPQTNSAKTPVNFAGYVAANYLEGLADLAHWDDAMKQLDGTYLIDVRSTGEYSRGHAPHSINIPVDDIRGAIERNELPFNETDEVYVYCQVGIRGYIATRVLAQHGFKNVKNISGGWLSFPHFRFPAE